MAFVPSTLRCPTCGSRLEYTQVTFGRSFSCPACQEQLQIPPRYRKSVTWSSLLLAIVLPLGWGLRGLDLFFAVLIVWFPVWTFAQIVVKRVLPPRIEKYSPQSLSLFNQPPL